MVRDEVLFYATIALLVFLAFFLMPTYERMTDRIEVDPRTKAATSPTSATTPQIAYPSKSAFGASHISPFLNQKASEQPTRPSFPAFEAFTTQKDIQQNQQAGVGTAAGSQTMNGTTPPLATPTSANRPPLATPTSANTPPLATPPPTQSSVNGFQQTTLAAPSPTTGGSNAPDDPLNQYVLKSSLVPYVCPTGACSMDAAGRMPSSRTPGDMDMPDYTRMKPNQKNIGRPRNEAFAQQPDEPQPFLTDFAPFTK